MKLQATAGYIIISDSDDGEMAINVDRIVSVVNVVGGGTPRIDLSDGIGVHVSRSIHTILRAIRTAKLMSGHAILEVDGE